MTNELIQEQRSEQSGINYPMKCFGEAKSRKWLRVQWSLLRATWSRTDPEDTNWELEQKTRGELAESKGSLLKAVHELDSERRAREIIDQVCDELTGNIGEEKDEERRESLKIREEMEEEMEMMQLADVYQKIGSRWNIRRLDIGLRIKMLVIEESTLSFFRDKKIEREKLTSLMPTEKISQTTWAEVSRDARYIEEEDDRGELKMGSNAKRTLLKYGMGNDVFFAQWWSVWGSSSID